MRQHRKFLRENKRTGTIYVLERFPDAVTIEHQHAPNGEISFVVEYKYPNGWRAVASFYTKSDAIRWWNNSSKFFKRRMIARSDDMSCRVSAR